MRMMRQKKTQRLQSRRDQVIIIKKIVHKGNFKNMAMCTFLTNCSLVIAPNRAFSPTKRKRATVHWQLLWHVRLTKPLVGFQVILGQRLLLDFTANSAHSWAPQAGSNLLVEGSVSLRSAVLTSVQSQRNRDTVKRGISSFSSWTFWCQLGAIQKEKEQTKLGNCK